MRDLKIQVIDDDFENRLFYKGFKEMRLYSVFVYDYLNIPLLFICKDIEENYFLFYHNEWTDEYSEMVVSQVFKKEVIALINKRLSVGNFFKEKRESKYVYIIREYVTGKQTRRKYKKLPENIIKDIKLLGFLEMEEHNE